MTDLKDGLTNAGIGLLDVKQLADGRSDVGDVYLAGSGSVLYLPSVEKAWDMGVVGIPRAMCSTRGLVPRA